MNNFFASGLLMAAASAEIHYYEGYGAPIFINGVPNMVTKISIGLDDSDLAANRWITQDVTVVFENIVSGETMSNQSSYYSVTACIENIPDQWQSSGQIRYTCYEMDLKGQTTDLSKADRGQFEVTAYRTFTWPGQKYQGDSSNG